MSQTVQLTQIDRLIINSLQGGFPLCDEPYAEVAISLGITETELIKCIEELLKSGMVSRFGPLFNPERLGGAVTLAALKVPEDRFEEVTQKVNQHQEIAHNYARSHEFNMWFVIATETPGQIEKVIRRLEAQTGLEVFNFPKQKEFFIGLKLEV